MVTIYMKRVQAAEQEKALCEQRGKIGAAEMGASKPDEVELGAVVTSNGRYIFKVTA